MFSLRIIFGCFGPWTIFWVREEGGARYFFFLSFWNFCSIGLCKVYGMSILDKYPFLVIHGPGGDFLMGQEVGGAGQFFWYFWDLLSIGLPTVYNTKILNEHPLFLLILGPFLGMARSGWDIFSFLILKHSPGGG